MDSPENTHLAIWRTFLKHPETNKKYLKMHIETVCNDYFKLKKGKLLKFKITVDKNKMTFNLKIDRLNEKKHCLKI